LPEVHRVEVPLKDLFLGELLFELASESRLVDLPLDRPLGLTLRGDDDVLHVLLGDRRPTLSDRTLAKVRYQGAKDRFPIHTSVFVEALVLDRDHGVLQ
jgi:hypothetical protein